MDEKAYEAGQRAARVAMTHRWEWSAVEMHDRRESAFVQYVVRTQPALFAAFRQGYSDTENEVRGVGAASAARTRREPRNR